MVINHESFVFKYTLSATAACFAESVTYPMDLTKTRLQVQGEAATPGQGQGGAASAASRAHRGMLATAAGIAREEGIRKLWQGVTPALYRHIVYSGSRLTLYEILRDKVFGKSTDGTFPIWKAAMAGMLAGMGSQLIASPTDLIKVRLQMEGRRRLDGKPVRVKNTAHAFRQIVAEGGVRGLWKGWIPNVQRAGLVNLGELATYDSSKQIILSKTNLQDNYITHTLASVCSGFVSAVVGTPADVIKTRIMNQTVQDGKGLLYKGSLDCLIKTVEHEGFFALYKGFIPIWARMAPWTLCFWVSYEQVRRLTGTSSF